MILLGLSLCPWRYLVGSSLRAYPGVIIGHVYTCDYHFTQIWHFPGSIATKLSQFCLSWPFLKFSRSFRTDKRPNTTRNYQLNRILLSKFFKMSLQNFDPKLFFVEKNINALAKILTDKKISIFYLFCLLRTNKSFFIY